MPRDLLLGNGRLLVNFDRHYRLRDIYYPTVGQENQSAGHPFRFGVWAEGEIAWIEDFGLRLDYAPRALVGQVGAEHPGLGLGLECRDCVDFHEDVFLRQVRLLNRRPRRRQVRLFFHHDFHLLGTVIGDTAYFDPEPGAIIHYKGARYFLAAGRVGERGPCRLERFATGHKEFGVEGTWRDAEDGELSGNAIAQGAVDSTIGFSLELEPMGEQTLYYWLCAGRSCAEVSGRHRRLLEAGPQHFLGRTARYWAAWVAGRAREAHRATLPEPLAELLRRSLLIMRTQADEGGAILAATDSDIMQWGRDTYAYMWPRDGALCAAAFDAAGHPEVAARFFGFCERVVDSEGYFLHKFNPDGSLGSSWHPWVEAGERRLPIQEDQTALVLWALWEHYRRWGDTEFARRLYETLVGPCADFLVRYRDPESGLPLPSYDLWEERWGVHAWTLGAVFGGMVAARRFAEAFGDEERTGRLAEAEGLLREGLERLWLGGEGRYARSLLGGAAGRLEPDPTPDASLFGLFLFGLLPASDSRFVATAEQVSARLAVPTEVGGLARYEGDGYQRRGREGPGNPWVICTLWRARWLIERSASVSELSGCLPLLEWVRQRGRPSGALAEQLDPRSGEPVSVCPLTWSHAEYVAAAVRYLERREELRLEELYGDYYSDPT